MPVSRPLILALLALGVCAAGAATCRPPGGVGAAGPDERVSALSALQGLDRPVSFEKEVKPVLENRCVVCHGCYDAPCQLLLSSPEGAARGASKAVVYDTTRLLPMKPTRLGIDAHTSAQWRAKGFFPVQQGPEVGSASTPGETAQGANEGLVLRMLALGLAKPFAPGERLPASVGLDINRALTCAEPDEFDAYARAHPQGGMPYGTAPLTQDELRVLASWALGRAPAPPPPALPASAEAQAKAWEALLNGASLKERLVARYLYEHWFVAHLVFGDQPAGPFFRLVRSRTPSGQPIDEIPSVRPYDDPDGAFWYRLRPIDGTLLLKTHIVYALSPARMERLQQLFFASDWQATRWPGYAPALASNPFVAFDQIPPRSRYRFLLDDAQFFVDTFIRGPVCRGQVAVDVIEDHFWVSFLDPDHDLSVTNPDFLAKTQTLLALPGARRGALLPGPLWLEYDLLQRKYLAERERFYAAADPSGRGPALDWIWDGNGDDPNALLTVFRNFDNATVVKGFVGDIPKTAWIIDYPIFERIYYDLVAGYDVFGDVAHQISTRLYMDHLRMQSENLFLQFLPAQSRAGIRASWYVGATKDLDYTVWDRLHGGERGTQVPLRGPDVKAELLELILGRSHAVAGPPDGLNRCAAPPCDRAGATALEQAAERELQKLASVRGAWVALMPEVALLRVRADETGISDLVYALVHNDAHTNVAFLFDEAERRIPEQDTLTVVRGHFGAYPNFFFEVGAAQIGAFVTALRAVTTPADFEQLAGRYGVRRSSPAFWATSDWLREDLRRANATQAGLYDLDRYLND